MSAVKTKRNLIMIICAFFFLNIQYAPTRFAELSKDDSVERAYSWNRAAGFDLSLCMHVMFQAPNYSLYSKRCTSHWLTNGHTRIEQETTSHPPHHPHHRATSLSSPSALHHKQDAARPHCDSGTAMSKRGRDANAESCHRRPPRLHPCQT